MPLFNTTEPVEQLQSLSPIEVMTATVMTDGQATQSIALPPSPINRAIDLAFFARFASNPPGAVDYQLQISLVNNVAAEFFDIGASMTNSETVGGIVVVTDVVARFARVIANDADTVAVTISILSL